MLRPETGVHSAFWDGEAVATLELSWEVSMFLSYLIDPNRRTVEQVSDGFDRASELLACESEAPELHSLWQDISDPDSSVDVASSRGAEDEPCFRVRLTHSGKTRELVVAGRGVLIACGAVPDEIARQIATTRLLEAHIEYLGDPHSAAADWLKSELGSHRRIPAKRAPAKSRKLRRNSASSER